MRDPGAGSRTRCRCCRRSARRARARATSRDLGPRPRAREQNSRSGSTTLRRSAPSSGVTHAWRRHRRALRRRGRSRERETEVHGAAHQQPSHDASAQERALQRLCAGSPRAAPRARRRRVAASCACSPASRSIAWDDGEPRARQEQLPRRASARFSSRWRQDALGHAQYANRVSVRVRMAPSPTGLPPHRRRPHGPLQLALRARTRAASSCCGSRTPTRAARSRRPSSRSRSRCAGSGSTGTARSRFQLDRHGALPRGGAAARRGGQGVRGRGRDPHPHARRGRRPPGTTSITRPRSRSPNEKLEDLVLVRVGRPADVQLRLAGRGLARRDHARHPRRRPRLEHAEADPASSRRSARELPGLRARAERLRRRRQEALEAPRRRSRSTSSARRATSRRRSINFLALLGWSYDGETTIMSRDELVERFTLERVGASPATFDYAKLDWMNGVYLRALPPDEYADAPRRATSASRATTGTRSASRKAAPLVQEKIATLGEFPAFAGFFFGDVEPDRALGRRRRCCRAAARGARARSSRSRPATIEAALRGSPSGSG